MLQMVTLRPREGKGPPEVTRHHLDVRLPLSTTLKKSPPMIQSC